MKACFIFLLSILIMQQSYSQQKKVTVSKAPVKKLVSKTQVKPLVKAVMRKSAVKNTTVNNAKPTVVKTMARVDAKSRNSVEVTNAALTSREKDMINEINTLRTNPSSYCAYVNRFILNNDADEDTKIAAKELVDQLRKMKPLSPLSINQVMYSDARQYGQIMAKKNIFEHSNLPYNENLSLGYQNIRDAIVDLLIDSDIPDRGHRKNLLSEQIKYVAVYELPGKVQDIGWCYVQEFK